MELFAAIEGFDGKHVAPLRPAAVDYEASDARSRPIIGIVIGAQRAGESGTLKNTIRNPK